MSGVPPSLVDMDLLDRAVPLPLQRPHPGLGLVVLHGGMTRVTRRDGEVLGYVEPIEEGRYRAKRLIPRGAQFRVIGDFWTADEAVDALRYL